LWHPNVLGAVLLLCLAGPALLLLKGKEENGGNKGTGGAKGTAILSFISFLLAFAVLALSFSRSAWLGAGAAGGLLVAWATRADRLRLWPAAAAGVITLALIVAPLRALFFTRATADARSPLERYSVEERTSVARVALDLAGRHLLTGVGAGAFVQAMAADPAITVTREPVHNVPLLVLAETGLPGALALGALGLAVALELARRRRAGPRGLVMGAVLAGLLATALFDHFLWSASPGRTLAMLALGLWAAAGRTPGEAGYNDGDGA
jgi:O-antigen ligase